MNVNHCYANTLENSTRMILKKYHAGIVVLLPVKISKVNRF